MRTARLGALEVSALCLGTLPFGSTVDEGTSFAILDRFAEAGGTFLDTANNYVSWAEGGTGDESEAVLGRWLAARGNRDSVVLGTKVGARPSAGGGYEGLSAEVVRSGVAGSLRRLGTDRVDVHYSHVEDRSVELAETLGAFAGLVADGSVREIACSNHAVWRVERARAVSEANGWPKYAAAQLRFSYLRPRPGYPLPESGHVLLTEEMADFARSEGDFALVAYSTLQFGQYAGKPLREENRHVGNDRRLAVLGEVADELGLTRNQVVLGWVMARGVVPVVGVSSVAQVEEALGAADLVLPDEVLARLDSAA
ncbi:MULTISPECIES: aldo/keto reductase [Actinosynnema]|uniref:aldo/keto reductase n=1 Tax=Actinosynnema TaxID=40566 RepID=UPI0020A33C85|nr:aldo/keto reductase [Actinosynnema pretiosum]MCP2098337.1 putative oxidoreductase [Actinosynnema pretiosum]